MQFPELKYPFDIKFFHLKEGRNIAYTLTGEGKDQTLLLVHGLSSYIPAWIKNLDELSKHFKCVAIDLPGYGKSDEGIHDGSMNYYSNILFELIEGLNLKNVTLVGHSMGGHVCINTALKFLDLFSRLILIAPAGLETFNEQESEQLKNTITPSNFIQKDDEKIINSIKYNFFKMPPEAEFMIDDWLMMIKSENYLDYAAIVCNSLYSMLDEPVNYKLSYIKQKTLLLYGENDNLIPNKYLHPDKTTNDIFEKEGSKIPDVIIKKIPKAGHFLQLEKWKEVNKEIISFIVGR